MSDELIDKLVEESSGEARPLTPSLISLLWAAVAGVGAVCINSLLFAMRGDLREALGNFLFVVSLVSLAGMSWLSARIAIESGFPGRVVSRNKLIGLLALSLIFLATLVIRFFRIDFGSDIIAGASLGGCQCTMILMATGALPALSLFISLRSLAPVSAKLSGLMLGFAAGASGALVLAFDCASASPTHAFIYHLLPIALVAAVAAKLGPILLRW